MCAIHPPTQIDRLNLEAYANLEYWVSDLDKRIESILLQRLTQIIHAFCAEFDRTDDGDTRSTLPPRGAAAGIGGAADLKKGKKGGKDDKVCFCLFNALEFSRKSTLTATVALSF